MSFRAWDSLITADRASWKIPSPLKAEIGCVKASVVWLRDAVLLDPLGAMESER